MAELAGRWLKVLSGFFSKFSKVDPQEIKERNWSTACSAGRSEFHNTVLGSSRNEMAATSHSLKLVFKTEVLKVRKDNRMPFSSTD